MNTNLTELFNNPITIIATALALFFSVVAIGRNLIARRARRAANATKPYTVTDPYHPPTTPPPPASTPLTSAAATISHPSPTTQKPGNKVFRRLGEDENTASSSRSTNDYIWE